MPAPLDMTGSLASSFYVSRGVTGRGSGRHAVPKREVNKEVWMIYAFVKRQFSGLRQPMLISRKLSAIDDVEEVSVMMGTPG